MITLCHAMSDSEVMYLRTMLQAADIPFHIQGENFGTLYPGLQISSYNERIFKVPEESYEEALVLVEELRDFSKSSTEELTNGSKLRVIIETLLFGWSVPNGKKKTTNKARNEMDGSVEPPIR